MKILIVEDEIRISNLLKMYFKRESIDVDIATSGDIGLKKAIQKDYDAIILDIFLPEIDGFSILEELRKTKTTPVLLLTAQSEEKDLQQACELGANAFISKPFSPSDVLAKLKNILT